jgi:hypothetical protein
METVEAFKFSRSAKAEKPVLQHDVKTFLNSKYDKGCIFGLDDLKSEGVFRLAGWCFDFRPYLTRYLVKQHGQWAEAYAPNRTLLRRATYGRIDEIVQP